jgi:hypothetical protein
MRVLHGLVAFGLVLMLSAGAGAAPKEKAKKGKKGGHGIHGVVESVDGGTLVVKVHHRGKKGDKQASKSADRTFKLSGDTKYEFVKITRSANGGKPEKETKPAAASDLKKGQHVVIHAKGDVAEKVSILEGKGKGKGGKKKAA